VCLVFVLVKRVLQPGRVREVRTEMWSWCVCLVPRS
jgi:hypothetical protein